MRQRGRKISKKKFMQTFKVVSVIDRCTSSSSKEDYVLFIKAESEDDAALKAKYYFLEEKGWSCFPPKLIEAIK